MRRRPLRSETAVAVEALTVGGIGALHALDHALVPRKAQLALHAVAAGAAVGGALLAGASTTQLGLKPSNLPRGVVHGLASGAVIAAGVGAGAVLPATRNLFLDERVMGVTAGEVAWKGLVEIPIGTALYEEVLFRGVLLGLASRRMPMAAAVAVTSVAFGLWHVFPALRNQSSHPITRDRHGALVVAATVANTAVLGALLSFQRLKTGSLAAPVLAHAASNAVSFLVAAGVARAQANGSIKPIPPS